MRKMITFLYFIVFGLFNTVPAQTTLPNGGFEDWDGLGSNTEEPVNWNGNKTGGGFANLGPQTCYQETSGVHSGTYCLKLQNRAIFGTVVNATATTGKIEVPSLDTAEGYIHTITAEPDFNYPFTGRPDSLVGWFKFTQEGTDIGRIQAIIHEDFDVELPDQSSSESYIIGQATYNLPDGDSNNWTRFSVPFVYENETVPSYILMIAMASTNIGGASSDTKLWVDDLAVVYSTVGVVENDFGGKIQVYPNPTRGDFSIDLGKDYKSVIVNITGLNGELIQSEQFEQSRLLDLTVAGSAGNYLVTILSEEKKAVIRLVKE